jgi:uncharacterized protein (TIGR02646 family)
MRRVKRDGLASETMNALQLFQNDANNQHKQGNLDPIKHWKGKRKTKPLLAVCAVLKRMAGTRERCMYCVDSEGSDIEHFWPKTRHSNKMYQWKNLLIACSQCGRFKGEQFPLCSSGKPLLIDPSAEDPWEYLDFDPDTGNLNARYLLSLADYSRKGQETVTVLRLDKREGISAGYRKTYRRLCQLVTEWTNQRLAKDYVERLREADDHGLLGWFLRGSGQNEPVFSRFREHHQDAWVVCQKSFF